MMAGPSLAGDAQPRFQGLPKVAREGFPLGARRHTLSRKLLEPRFRLPDDPRNHMCLRPRY